MIENVAGRPATVTELTEFSDVPLMRMLVPVFPEVGEMFAMNGAS
jgi:hypothetical protein